MSLYTLVYHSKALIDFDRHAMHSLLFVSRRNNMAKHITGVLLYAEGHFIQVLEGKNRLLWICIKLSRTIPDMCRCARFMKNRYRKGSLLTGQWATRNSPELNSGIFPV